jgi:transcriptional regulator with XRE-family HTH domain
MRPDDLKKWRERTGYSQGKLSRILGVDVMTVSRWERGIMQVPSFLKWALAYIELKGKEIKPQTKRCKTRLRKGKAVRSPVFLFERGHKEDGEN